MCVYTYMCMDMLVFTSMHLYRDICTCFGIHFMYTYYNNTFRNIAENSEQAPHNIEVTLQNLLT